MFRTEFGLKKITGARCNFVRGIGLHESRRRGSKKIGSRRTMNLMSGSMEHWSEEFPIRCVFLE